MGNSKKGPKGKNEDLFFLAIVPDQQVQEVITQMKEEMWSKFGSRQALKSPPHVTLYMPFKWPEKKEVLLHTALSDFVQGELAFQISLKDYGAFPPRVIYVAVQENQALRNLQKHLLQHLRRNLSLDNGDYKSRPFHPHITIAFRDLKKTRFYEAWAKLEAKTFQQHFTANSISLLKHDGKQWQVHSTFPLIDQS